MLVKIKLLNSNSKKPVKGTPEAACYDVYAYDIEQLSPSKVKVRLGFMTEIPEGYKGYIVPRSNITKHEWFINNSPAQIDSDYRGEWVIIFTANPIGVNVKLSGATLKYPEFPYSIGDRVAQIYFSDVHPTILHETTEISVSERGEGGFGSTGLK